MFVVSYLVHLQWGETMPLEFEPPYCRLNFTALFLSVNQKQTNKQTSKLRSSCSVLREAAAVLSSDLDFIV